MSSVASMKAEIERLEAALGGLTIKASKDKKDKDPNAPKRTANDYIKFTVRVGNLFKAAIAAAKEAGDEDRIKQLAHPVTINKQFCSFLKDQRSKEVEKNGKQVTVPDYDAWEDTEIVEAFESWTPPEHSKMELAKKAKSATSSVDGSEASADSDSAPASASEAKKERKKREPMSEEAKAAMKEKRAATVAAKKAAAAPAAPEPSTATPEPVAAVAPVAEPAAAAPTPAPAPKKSPMKKVAKTYTIEELKDFTPLTIEGVEYGVNKRGDVVDDDCNFVGLYNTTKKTLNKSAPKPEYWDEIVATEEAE
jgi:hypothetical protein